MGRKCGLRNVYWEGIGKIEVGTQELDYRYNRKVSANVLTAPPYSVFRLPSSRYSSPTDKATIHNQIDTGTKGGSSAEQEHGWSNQFVHCGHSSQRRIRLKLLTLFGHLGSDIHRRKRIAGADRIDPNPSVCPFHRQAFGQMHYCRL